MNIFQNRKFKPIVCTAVGLFNLILMFLNYTALFVTYSGDSVSYGFSAYATGSVGSKLELFLASFMKDANVRFMLTISSIVLIIVAVLSAIMLLLGVFTLLKEFFHFKWLDCVDVRVFNYLSQKLLLVNSLALGFAGMLTLIACIANLYSSSRTLLGLRPGLCLYSAYVHRSDSSSSIKS